MTPISYQLVNLPEWILYIRRRPIVIFVLPHCVDMWNKSSTWHLHRNLLWTSVAEELQASSVLELGTKAAGKAVGWRSRRRWLRRRLRRRRRDDCSSRTAATSVNSDARRTVCDASSPSRRHPATLLTDLNNPSNRTCWISAPASQSTDVNITVNLGKKYEVYTASILSRVQSQ